MATFRPAQVDLDGAVLDPAEFPEPLREGATHAPAVVALPGPRKPMVGTFAGICARAASGHATAAPSRVMKPRRLTQSPRRRGRAARRARRGRVSFQG